MPIEFHKHENKSGEHDFVRISYPHQDANTVTDVLATDAHKAKYPVEWQAYQDKLNPPPKPKAKPKAKAPAKPKAKAKK